MYPSAAHTPVLEREPGASAAPLASPLLTRKPAPGARRPLRVLVVEDNPDGREMLRLLLQMVGYQVAVARDGPEGVEVALRERPQAAVIDIGLPRLDGYEVARRLRAALGPDIFLITHTSHGRPEDRQRALQAGFDVHLVKPVDPGELFAWLERAARRS
jgi:CheY-like chemotaxis protein